jgi:hypothetical protein
MHRNTDGTFVILANEAKHLAKVLSLAEELADQMSARSDPDSDNCEDKLFAALDLLKEKYNVTSESLSRIL